MVVPEWEAYKGDSGDDTTTTQTKSWEGSWKWVVMCKKMEDKTLGGEKLKGYRSQGI